MTGRSAFRLGQGIGGLIAIGFVIAYAMWGDFLRFTGDLEDKNVVVWMYDRDAAPGQTVRGRAWVDGDSSWIVGVNVYFVDERIAQDDCPADCKASPVDFAFQLPVAAVPPDGRIGVDIEVVTRPFGRSRFRRWIPIHSATTSALRRAGKAGAAAGCLALVSVLLFGLARHAVRRNKDPSPLWLVPVVIAGAASFMPLLIDVTRLQGAWFDVLVVAVWTWAAFAIADRLNRRIGLQRYEATQMMVDVASSEPFRGAAVAVPIRPVEDLENAWAAVGLHVRRAGRDLIITAPGRSFAVVPVPRSASFGGESLVLRATDPDIADLLIASATNVLGELRMH